MKNKCKHLQIEFHHVYLTTCDLCRYHILLIAFSNEVLLNNTEELTNVWIALNHIFETLQPVDLNHLLLEHEKLLYLLLCDSKIILCLFQMKLRVRWLLAFLLIGLITICFLFIFFLWRILNFIHLLFYLLLLLFEQFMVCLQLLLKAASVRVLFLLLYFC